MGFPVRMRYTKRGKVRFIGHRDVARAFERALRITALPLSFTEGFSPHPKIGFGLALSVGFESDAEFIDVQLDHSIPLEALAAEVSEALPEGIDVTGAVALADRAPALQDAVTAVGWQVTLRSNDSTLPLTHDRVQQWIVAGLSRPELLTTRRRKGREVVEDVRAEVRSVDVVGAADGYVRLEMECGTQPRSPKPTEVLAAIAEAIGGLGEACETRVLRTHQWIERDGARLEPLSADLRPRVPEARAS